MFFQLLSGCWDSGFGQGNPLSHLPEQARTNHACSGSISDAGDRVVLVQTSGPAAPECFILERRECYWSLLGAAHAAS
jgi:hypothetical protein